MADASDPNLTAGQEEYSVDFEAVGSAGEGGADSSDSDDYDPSIIAQEESSVSLQTSDKETSAALDASVLSPVNSTNHPLPPRPVTQMSATTASMPSNQQSSITASQPKMRGGFEVDEDEVDIEEDTDNDSKDILDIYEPVNGTEDDTSTNAAAHEVAVDSLSSSAKQANGVALPAHSQDASISAPGVISPAALPNNIASPQRATTATPINSTHVQASSASDVNNASSLVTPKGRLAHDVVGILEDRIKDDPRGDIDAWLELIEELKGRNKQEEVRLVYERFLKVFPLSAEQWCAYIRWEEQHDRKFEMENLFKRSLLEIANVDLWSIYINYIRRRNSMQTGDINKSYKIIFDAFSFALDQVGMDKDSGKLWQEYVDFIKTGPGVVGGSGWQDGAKTDSLRSAYQKAIAIPTSALNGLWKEYDVFENQIHKVNGRKNLQERSPAYMTARSAFTQLQNLTKDLDRTSRPRLPPLLGFEGDTDYMHQVSLWKAWIAWEKDDNLVLKDEDLSAYNRRILFAYKQALMALQFWPETWYDAVVFCFSASFDAEAAKFLSQGTESNPESCLLAFKAADQVERTTSNDDLSDPGAKQRLQKVREPYDKLFDALYDLLRKLQSQELEEVQILESARAEEMAAAESNSAAMGPDEIASLDSASIKERYDAQIKMLKERGAPQQELMQQTISFAWIALMRATRRIQGKGLPTERQGGFRAVFFEARKRGQITSDVYIESALIEHYCYKDSAGTKIFDRGLKLFPNDEKFALEYLKHLININDITNARAVFETTVSKITANLEKVARAKAIFSFMHEYESHFGDLAQIVRLEKRMGELYPTDPSLKEFTKRFTSPTFDPTTVIPVISPKQTQPKSYPHPSVETQIPTHIANSPITRLIDSITTNSPKRPFPGDDLDDGPRKVARGESPLKGAAGRRMNQQQQQQQRQVNGLPTILAQVHQPFPPPLPTQITYLLSIMPKASTYVDTRFDPGKMVNLIRETHLPPSMPMTQRDHQPPLQQSHPPTNWPQHYPSQQQPPMIPPGYMPTPGPPYTAAPFRYT